MAFLELVTLLPPGAPSQTRLARHGQRLVVLRELKEGTACFYPDASDHLVTVEEVGELQGKRHALFPYVPGVSLRDLVDAFAALKKPVPLGLVAGVVLAGARALAAHQPPRPHGGLHDAALQVAFTGETYVLDFGAPRVTRFKALGRDSIAADVFALGGIVHAALTGYQGPYVNPPSALPRPSLAHPEAKPGLDDVVLRALSPQVPGRQPDVATFVRELAAAVSEPWAPEDLHALVNSLFQDRVRLLHSLSGLTEALEQPGLGDEVADEATAAHRAHPGPSAPIPMGTEPGAGLGDGTNPGVRLPWLVDEVGDEELPVEEDGGTQPRIEAPRALEEPTSPGAAPPTARPSRPGASTPASDQTEAGQRGPRVSAANHKALADETEAGQRGPRVSAANLKALSVEAEAGHRAPRASAPPPRAAAPDEPMTRPRASGQRDAVVDRVAPPPEDTAPRARAPAPAEDTAPRARPSAPESPGPRNTTTHERLRAAGQERVATPPTGLPALELGEPIEAQPTSLRPRLVVPEEGDEEVQEEVQEEDEQVHAETMQKLTAVPAPKRKGRGLIAFLLLLIAGLGAVFAMKEGRLPAPEPLAGWLGLGAVPDAGEVTASDDAGTADTAMGVTDAGELPEATDAGGAGDAGAVAAAVTDGGASSVAEADGGESDGGVADGGVADGGQADAGATDAGASPDAGVADAGAPTEKPKPPPKKKKRRR